MEMEDSFGSGVDNLEGSYIIIHAVLEQHILLEK